MKSAILQGLLCILIGAFTASITKAQLTTPRSASSPGQVIKKFTSRLSNTSNAEIITDVRTPPKVKQMIKKNEVRIEHTTEGSHPGVAEPIEEDVDIVEDTRKKILFYKIERLTTTDSGISTWVLLSGQSKTSTTTKPPKLPNKNESIKNTTVVSTTNIGSKPLFKRRPSIVKLTSTTSKSTSTTIAPATATTGKNSKFTQLKTTAFPTTENQKNTTFVGLSNLRKKSSNPLSNSTHVVKTNGLNKNISDSVPVTTVLTPELKDGDLELPSSTANSKKSRRPTNKKKKDKNRRKRPSADSKNDMENKTKVANKVSQKEKPISTQIYNYLAREVMPTVGVGLVGLVVTAGLASYFLYPFSGLRRSYEIDRKDKDLYYYDSGKIASDYDGGIAEEEAIGKVIAGMPFSSNNYGNSYSQKSLTNNRYRQDDSSNYQKPKGYVDSLQLQSVNEYNKNENYLYGVQYLNDRKKDTPSTYKKNIISQSVEASYTTNDQQFLAGNAPQEIVEEITPAAVPEHGPRNLKIRRRRNLENEVISNDINVDETIEKMNKFEVTGTIEKKTVTNVNSSEFNNQTKNRYSFVDFFKDLFTSKLRIGLELLQNQTLAFSRYLSSVHQTLYKLRNSNKDN